MPSTEINFDPKDSVIVVESVLVNKTAKFHSKLVLDTGATYTMISWEMADKLGLSPEKATETITFFSASGEVKSPLVKIEKVELEGIVVRNLKAVIHTLPEGSQVDGLIGLNFLRNFEVNLDFKKGVITLSK